MLKRRNVPLVVASLLVLLAPGTASGSQGGDYTVTNLVSDQPGVAAHLDPNLGNASGSSLFLFATEAGTIRGWSPAVPPPPLSTQTFVGYDGSDEDANYKGLAIAPIDAGTILYGADFHNAEVEMFDDTFQEVTPEGAFEDPKLPAGFAPFGIQTIGDAVFVTYAKQDADAEDEVAGAGLGFVDEFSTTGEFIERVASKRHLNAPRSEE